MDKLGTLKEKNWLIRAGNFTPSLLFLLLLALSIRSFLFEPFHIPSSSMKSTLLEGDYIFTSKYSYGYSKHSFPFAPNIFSGRIFYTPPKHGDIIVFKNFKSAKNYGARFVKRVIGVPGDKVQMIGGELYINDQKIQRKKIENFLDYESNNSMPRYIEALPNGIEHEILIGNTTHSLSYNTPVYFVPDNQFFVMGDNRNNSMDSRFTEIGFIPVENIIGRVRMIGLSFKLKKIEWLPFNFRLPVSLRFNRIMHNVV